MSLMMFDIDFFKTINDKHVSHAAGDEVLQELARWITQNLRSFDTVARYAGDEFVIVMPDTDVPIACAVAERLRVDVASKPFQITVPAGTESVTISIGVVTARPEGGNNARPHPACGRGPVSGETRGQEPRRPVGRGRI